MREQILDRLKQLQTEENIKILFACESGSRAWGFPSKDSDWDVRFIYIRNKDWYLRIDHESQRDVVELPINDELDINDWDLKKTLLQFRKSNPVLIEWLNSPIVYQANTSFVEALKLLIPDYYSPRTSFYHYISMAKKNFKQYLKGEEVRVKKYFYVLRPLLAAKWVLSKHEEPPPMTFEELLESMLTNNEVKAIVNDLLIQKRAGFESKYTPRIEIIHNFAETELSSLEGQTDELAWEKTPVEPLNELFLSILRMNG